MKVFFDPDGPVMQVLRRVTDLMMLNICFFLCCIPVLTVGASATAMYAVLLSPGEDRVCRRFFRAFRRNFRQGTILGLLLMAIGVVLVLDFRMMGSLEGYALVKYLLYLAGLVWLGVSSFSFGLTARFDNTVVQTLKNALLLAVSMLPRTVLMVLIDAAPLILLLAAPDWFGRSLILWPLVGFAACAWGKVWVLKDVFASLEKTKQ